MPARCRVSSTCRAAAPGPMPVGCSAARPSMPARWRAAPDQARQALHREARGAQCRRRAAPLDVPRRCARTDAGGAIGREALDAGTVASGASIKPGKAVPLRQDRCRWCDRPRGPRCRHGGERRRDQGRRGAPPRGARCRRRAPRRAPPRPVLAGADRWGVLGSGIKHYRSQSVAPNDRASITVTTVQCRKAIGGGAPKRTSGNMMRRPLCCCDHCNCSGGSFLRERQLSGGAMTLRRRVFLRFERAFWPNSLY